MRLARRVQVRRWGRDNHQHAGGSRCQAGPARSHSRSLCPWTPGYRHPANAGDRVRRGRSFKARPSISEALIGAAAGIPERSDGRGLVRLAGVPYLSIDCQSREACCFGPTRPPAFKPPKTCQRCVRTRVSTIVRWLTTRPSHGRARRNGVSRPGGSVPAEHRGRREQHGAPIRPARARVQSFGGESVTPSMLRSAMSTPSSTQSLATWMVVRRSAGVLGSGFAASSHSGWVK